MGNQHYDQRYDASRKTLGELLSTASPPIKVPEWQRSYSWTDAQVSEFWADLTAFNNRYPGTNIDGREYFLGSVVLVTEPSQNLLLDGQQRLATTTILLSVLRDSRLSYLADSAQRLQQKFISDYDDTRRCEQPKLTLNDYDKKFFADEIQSLKHNDLKPRLKSHKFILKAKQYFADRVAELYENREPREAYELNLRYQELVVDHISVVAVTSSDEDNAAAVFETLNDRGIGLSTTDLLRSLLIRRAKAHDRTEIANRWLNILAVSDQAPVDTFLRHYWISIHGDEKTRSLYRVVKEYLEDNNIDSLEFTNGLSRAVDTYREICTATADNGELRRSLTGINAVGAKVLYPALLAALSGCNAEGKKSDAVANFANMLLNLYVRYNVIGQKESTILETAVFNAAKDLRKTCDFDGVSLILQGKAPDLVEFVKQFSVCSIKRVQTATYLLRELDQHYRTTDEIVVAGTDKVHLEHIYPQTPSAKWKKFENPTAWLNRLGNLTLLGKTKNTSIQNSPFSDKKIAYSDSEIYLTRQLKNYEDWDEQQIGLRQKALALAAAQIWKFSNEEIPENLGKLIETASPDIEDEEELPDFPEIPS